MSKKVKVQIKSFFGRLIFEYEVKENTVKKTLVEAVKQGADLQGADLRGAYLRGADLQGAYLRGAYLQGAYLRGADLQGADLRGAYLRGADLRGAYLRGADLQGAYLQGADGEKIEVKKALVITGLYKYVCIPFIDKDGSEWLTLGCFTRTLKDWKKDFWNNLSEFPKDKENEQSQLRVLAFETAKKWFKLNK